MFSLGPFKTDFDSLLASIFYVLSYPRPHAASPHVHCVHAIFLAHKIWDNCNNLGPGDNHGLQWMFRDASAVQLQRLISRVEAYRMFSEMELPVLRLLSGAFLFWFIKYKFRKFELMLKRRFICERIYLFMHLAPSFRYPFNVKIIHIWNSSRLCGSHGGLYSAHVRIQSWSWSWCDTSLDLILGIDATGGECARAY